MKKYRLVRKSLTVGIFVLLISMNTFSITRSISYNPYTIISKESYTANTADGTTFYVDGNGPGNYSKIQDAINDSSDGDMVFVYNGTYQEHVFVNKSLKIYGEDMTTTMVTDSYNGGIFMLFADRVILSGFSIQNTKKYGNGIEVFSDNNIVSGNNVSKNGGHGIHLVYSENNTVVNNIVMDNYYNGIALWGVLLYKSLRHNISSNYVANNKNGIHIDRSFHNIVSKNICVENRVNGIWIGNTVNNTVSHNTISRNKKYAGMTLWCCYDSIFYRNNFTDNNNIGLQLRVAGNNKVIQNNFINNSVNAEFRRSSTYEIKFKIYYFIISLPYPDDYSRYRVLRKNIWDENYWGEPRSNPYPIPGRIHPFRFHGIIIPWMNFDWHPAKEPYDIGGFCE